MDEVIAVKMNERCFKCLLDKYRAKCPAHASEAERERYLQALERTVAANAGLSAPEVVEKIEQAVGGYWGETSAYGEIKRHFNALMLGLEQKLQQEADAAQDPLLRAMQFAMAGNFIDFGAMSRVDEGKLREFLDAAKDSPIDPACYQRLRGELTTARRLVYFTDNCGEIVADKVLLRVIRRLNPALQVTVILRGKPAINDATLEDAAQVNLAEAADALLGNGCGVAGTVLRRLPEEAACAVKAADLLLAKGQGNFESLSGCGLNLFYLFMCKCELFVERFGVPLYSGVLTAERE